MTNVVPTTTNGVPSNEARNVERFNRAAAEEKYVQVPVLRRQDFCNARIRLSQTTWPEMLPTFSAGSINRLSRL